MQNRENTKNKNNRENINIILVHGFMAKPEGFERMKEFFIANGYATNIFGYTETMYEKIKNNSDRLWMWLNKMNLVNHKLVLIGHSMGGLVIRKLEQDYSKSLKIIKLITLASPNDGIKYYNIPAFVLKKVLPEAVMDMKTNSKFLIELNKPTKEKNHNDKRILTYYVTKDELVSYRSSMIPESLFYIHTPTFKIIDYSPFFTNPFIRFFASRHINIIWDYKVFNILLDFIQR